MTKLYTILLLSLLTFFAKGQTDSELIAMLNELQPTYEEMMLDYDNNLLNSVEITLDKANNRINFTTPQPIEGVNISIKKRGDQVIIQQNNMTINKEYSITFPEESGISLYTVILQKDNNIVVKRLEKDWL